MAAHPPIRFFFPAPIRLADRTRLKQFILSIFRKEGVKAGGLNYVFCSDEYLLRINRDYLQHDYYTDIITFDLSEPGGPVQGEIYISVDRVRDNAKELAVSIQKELHRVIFHGVLHLCGYTDKTKQDQARMRALEEKYLDLYF